MVGSVYQKLMCVCMYVIVLRLKLGNEIYYVRTYIANQDNFGPEYIVPNGDKSPDFSGC